MGTESEGWVGRVPFTEVRRSYDRDGALPSTLSLRRFSTQNGFFSHRPSLLRRDPPLGPSYSPPSSGSHRRGPNNPTTPFTVLSRPPTLLSHASDTSPSPSVHLYLPQNDETAKTALVLIVSGQRREEGWGGGLARPGPRRRVVRQPLGVSSHGPSVGPCHIGHPP